ncbi:MAG: hypothetical protein U9R19_10520 [Bacteroidota bacterium]|nr:hypothetical protein [Bacteroidota bacterium]
MKKIFVFFLLIATLIPLSRANNNKEGVKKKFHFFYVCFSDLSNKAYVINALTDSLTKLSGETDEFLLFISNGENSSFYSETGSTEKIVSELNSINPYAPSVKNDFNKIIEYLNKSDIVFTSNSNNPLQMQFAGASFNYFIDEKYLNECTTFLIERFVKVNEFDFLENKENISFTFYLEKSSRKKIPVQTGDYKIDFYTFI